MRPFHQLPIILILGFICCSCTKVIKGEQGNNYISAKPLNKFHADFHDIGTYNTTYEFEFTNLSDEDISQYEGVLKVFDIVGKEIAAIEVRDTSGIRAKSSTVYLGSVQSDKYPIKLIEQSVEELETEWIADKVIIKK